MASASPSAAQTRKLASPSAAKTRNKSISEPESMWVERIRCNLHKLQRKPSGIAGGGDTSTLLDQHCALDGSAPFDVQKAEGDICEQTLETLGIEDDAEKKSFKSWLLLESADSKEVTAGSDKLLTEAFNEKVVSPIFADLFSAAMSNCSMTKLVAKEVLKETSFPKAEWKASGQGGAPEQHGGSVRIFEALQWMNREENKDLIQACVDKAKKTFEEQFFRTLGRLAAETEADQKAHELNSGNAQASKFHQLLSFGELSMFKDGINSLIGLPAMDEKVAETMASEHHCQNLFQPPNNKRISTCAKYEYDWVVKGKRPNYKFDKGRGEEVIDIDELLKHAKCEAAKLTREEVIALVLYTGPMYALYNQELREVLSSVAKNRQTRLDPLKFLTTIHMIISGLIKLSELTDLHMGVKLYRGLSGRVPPKEFTDRDTMGCRGGVELAFMSATRDMDVAMQYAGGSDCDERIIFEMSMGQVDRGADLAFLSQWKHEKEVCFPPLCNLEVCGDPRRVQCTVRVQNDKQHEARYEEQWFLVYPLRVNINLKSLTRKQHSQRRKEEFLGSATNITLEVQRMLGCMASGEAAVAKNRWTGCQRDVEEMQRLMVERCYEIVARFRTRPANWFFNDKNLQNAQNEVMELKSRARHVFNQYLQSKGRRHTYYDNYTWANWHRFTLGDLWCRYREKKRLGSSPEGVQDSARSLALEMGLIVHRWSHDSHDMRSNAQRNAQSSVHSDDECDSQSLVTEPPIVVAASEGLVERVELLLDAGEDIDGTSGRHNHFTALHQAVVGGHVAVVQLLIKWRANVEGHQQAFISPLMQAAMMGRVECVERLLAGGADPGKRLPKDRGSVSGWIAAYFAAAGGYEQCLRRLIAPYLAERRREVGDAVLVPKEAEKKEADHKERRQVQPLLHAAAWNGQTGCVRMLCEEFPGITVSETDADGYNAVHKAAWNGHVECVRAMIALEPCAVAEIAVNGRHAIHLAARYGHVECLTALVQDYQTPVGTRNRSGWTPLHLASRYGQVRCVEVLCVKLHANIEDDTGEAASVQRRRELQALASVATWFAPARSQAWEPVTDGAGALHLAAASGHQDCVDVLLQCGACPQRKDKAGNTALHHAAAWGRKSCIKALLDGKADPTMANASGKTALCLFNDREEREEKKAEEAAKKAEVEKQKKMAEEKRRYDEARKRRKEEEEALHHEAKDLLNALRGRRAWRQPHTELRDAGRLAA